MIKSKEGAIQVDGTGEELYADFAAITYALYKHGLPKDILEDAFNQGILSCDSESKVDYSFLAKMVKDITKDE